MTRLIFARSASGNFDFGEAQCARINAALAEKCGQREPRIPHSLLAAASLTLLHAVDRRAERMGIPQHAAVAGAVRERPELAKFTRGIAVPDGEDADVEAEDA